MTHLHAAVLGLIQGLSEFLPVSSSAHLTLAPWLLGWTDPGLTFDVALHAGTLVAILVYFWRDWVGILSGAAHEPRGPRGRLLALLVLGTLPAAFAGLALEKKAEEAFRSPAMIAGLLIVFGVLMQLADRAGRKQRHLDELNWAGALAVGVAQAFALMPGVSRSGVTMTAALLLGFTREASARLSFLLATPIIAGAAVLKLRHMHGSDLTGPFWIGVWVAALSGLLAVDFLMTRIRRSGVAPYAVYRVVAGAAVLVLYFARG